MDCPAVTTVSQTPNAGATSLLPPFHSLFGAFVGYAEPAVCFSRMSSISRENLVNESRLADGSRDELHSSPSCDIARRVAANNLSAATGSRYPTEDPEAEPEVARKVSTRSQSNDLSTLTAAVQQTVSCTAVQQTVSCVLHSSWRERRRWQQLSRALRV